MSGYTVLHRASAHKPSEVLSKKINNAFFTSFLPAPAHLSVAAVWISLETAEGFEDALHSVIWNCVHFYATTKARTRSPHENISIWLVDFAKTLAFSSYGWLIVMAVQLTAILLGHAQP